MEDYLFYLLSMFKQTKDKFYADEFGYIVKQLNAIGYEILKNKDYIFVTIRYIRRQDALRYSMQKTKIHDRTSCMQWNR